MSKSIAILDDQQFLAESLARRFTRRGFNAVPFHSILALDEYLKNNKVDICISDIELDTPYSGVDFLERLKSEGNTIPFIFLTGHGDDSDQGHDALLKGAAAVFAKPTDFSTLMARVCEILGIELDVQALATDN